MSFCIRNGGNDTQEDYYMNRDTDRVLRCLETGLVATIISPKRKPENLTLRVIMETKELICVRVQGARPELTINLKQVKDIRTGKKSSDFDKCLEESHKIDGKFCLVLLYGAEFNLKTLSLLAKDENNFKIFHQGLHELCFAGNNYLEQKDTWIWKQFHSVLRPGAYASYCAGSTDSVSVTFNEIRGWFVRTNCKISSKELKQLCKKLKLSDRLSFNEFCLLFNEFLHPSRVIGLNFSSYVTSNTKAKNEEKRIGFEMFREFMTNEQKTEFNPEEARKLIKNFLNDPRRSISDLHFTEKEFVDYLFSEDNDIYTSTEITDDMHQPLCAYWIASSHNTYVTGNQLSSESSVEPYARCLRMGCRCVELDCWDGTDGTPVIYHGKTLTSKVKLVDVLHVIKENAFYSSEYPVILSLENHCTLPQQRIMAKMLRDTFGDTLLTELIPNTRDELPTPHQLKHKILIKDRKLSKAEVARKVEASKERSGGRDENTDPDYDVIHADIKSGILHLKNTATDMWQTYFCIMNDQVLILTPPKDEEEETEDDIYDFPYEDVYVGDEDDVAVQIWFHGKKKSKTAEEIINNYRPKTSGCFLIRENDKNGYSISFWNNDKTCHCRINYKDGKYYLNQAVGFDNIVEMVEFYQQTPLYLGQEKSILLSDPIPVEPDFLNQPWYHATDRHGAENLLRRATDNGTFLIRPCGRPKCPYSLSVIYNRTIRHFAISREGGLFSIGSFRFLSLEKLVDFFKKRPIAKQMVLKKPATSALLDADDIAAKYADVNIYGDGIYAHVDNHQEKLVSVRALYDYIGDPDTQLSFKRGAIITNVMEIDDPWWKGDHGEQTELLFPANYVEVIDTVAEEEEKLREITIPLETCILELAERCGDKRFAFKLYSSKQTEGYIFACDDQTEFVEWLHAIGNVIQQTEETKEQRQKQEQIHGRAKELSDLMVYCQSVPFQHAMKGGRITEMASISERDMSQYNSKEKVGIMTRYNCKQLSRVYPDGIRVFSSNYDPVQMWQYGCQMVALNYQKADKFLQLNNSLFLRNRRCGYVLKPECMRSVNFSPFEMKSFMSVEPVTITVAVLAGRNIFGGKITTATNPFVSVEIIGLNLDIQKRRTGSISKGSNSLSPIWDDQLFPFDVTFPDLAFLRFEILDESFEKTKTIHAQATYPLTGLRQGFRCVHLNNHFSEKHELSSLLVHIETKNPMEAEERNVFKMIEELRYNSSFPGSVKKQLEETETKLLKYLDERQKKRRRETNLQGSPGTRK